MAAPICLITGATGGLGTATALALAGLALSLEFASATGQFFAFQKPIASNAYSHDAGVQERLWIESLKLSGLC